MKKRVKSFLSIVCIIAYIFVGCVSVFAVERAYILPSTTCKKAPKSNVFQLKDSSEKYILLDSTDEGYFILKEKYCTIKAFSVDGNPVPFDPENQNSIAYWLNNDYLTDKDFEGRLPQVIIDSLVERVYKTEGGGKHVDFSADYETECKVVLLSQTEWSKYNSKFGYADDTSSSFWFLRSVRELTGSPLAAAVSSPNSGLTIEAKWTSAIGIRPAFYLSKDFFEKVSLDIENTGDAVISIIRNGYELPELKKLYTDNEVTLLTQTDIAPASENVTVTGRGIVGEKIVGKYSFQSLDGKEEDGTMIQWQKSADKSTWSTILGAETTDYVPTSNDVGCYIRMKVSPMTGSMAGASYESVPLAVAIREISKPVAENVRIINNQPIRPGTILDVKYSYSDENRDICSETVYIWEASSDKISTEKIGDKRNLKLTNDVGGKYVRVGVVPKKQTNSADGRKTVEGDIKYSEWVEVLNLPVASEIKITRDADATVTVLKTEDVLSIKSLLTPLSNAFTAEYSIDSAGEDEVILEWQGSDYQYGPYSYIGSNASLEYTPNNTMWVRAKVYTKNDGVSGKATYSQPIFIGEDKQWESKGELTLTQNLTAGKTYEIWIVNDKCKNTYTYSFNLKCKDIPGFSSEKYMIKTLSQDSGASVIGVLSSDEYRSEFSFKAGEMVLTNGGEITISDVLTTEGLEVSVARVYLVEK